MPRPGLLVAILAYLAALAGILAGGVWMHRIPDVQQQHPLLVVLLAQGAALLPVLVVLAWRRGRWADCGLAAPRPLHLVAGLALAPAAVALSFVGIGVQTAIFGLPPADQPVEVVLNSVRQLVGWGGLAVLACLLPGAIEEALFRGVILSGLRRRLPALLAVAICALAFAALHLSPWRILPQFLLGILLGLVALRSASAWPAAIVHAGHNLIVLVLSLDGPALAPRLQARPGGALALIALGLFVLASGTAIGWRLLRRPATQTVS